LSNPVQEPLRFVNPVATSLILVALLVALGVGIAPNLDTRLVEIGESIWPGYASELRRDPQPPDCDLDEAKAKLETCPPEGAAPRAGAEEDPFAGEDPFAEEGDEDPFAGEDPFAEEGDEDPFEGEDPFAEEGDEDPFAEEGDEDPFAGDPFAEEPADEVNCAAQRAFVERCEERHETYAATVERITPGLVAFRTIELAASDFALFPFGKHLLVLVVLLGALSTTAHRMHIALRNPESRTEHVVAQVTQLVAHLLWLASCVVDYQIQLTSSADNLYPELSVMWAAGFALLAAVNVVQLVRPPADLEERPPEVLRLLMVVPLYVYMSIIAGAYFVLAEGHFSGQAVYLHQFTRIPNIYLGIGLYIWAGMMLSRTELAPRFFDVFTPFRLPPALLAWLVVVLAAFPTAYSGASGIFVIAAGAVIFERLRAVGATPRLALAATAMSGSLGVVLRPCLVVVLIAVLNNKVTTDDLFGWGLVVFGLTAVLSFIAFYWWNKEPVKLAPLGRALPEAGRALRPLLPYAGLTVAVGVLYYVLFKMTVNEHTAPVMLPALLLVLLVYDRITHAEGEGEWRQKVRTSVWPALRSSTGESSHHVGALLMVMAGSVGLGGVIERAEVMSLVPESFGSLFVTMTVLVVVMVIVGMTMDALGAVILVSVTIAHVADANGIDPVHFWMVVLVGFELGYLTPPVSLNHLLARQVIGPESEVETVDPKDTFWEANEHLLVPMGIMGTALLIVAYGPLLFY